MNWSNDFAPKFKHVLSSFTKLELTCCLSYVPWELIKSLAINLIGTSMVEDWNYLVLSLFHPTCGKK